MFRAIKIIIFGFALMILGGFIYVSNQAVVGSVPLYLIILSFNMYIGFILIIIGLIEFPKDKK